MIHQCKIAIALFTLLLAVGCPSDSDDSGSVTDGQDDTGVDGGTIDQNIVPDVEDETEDGSVIPGPSIGPTTQTECLENELFVSDTTQAECLQPAPDEITVGETQQNACEGESDPYITPTVQTECADVLAIGPVTMEPCESVGTDLPDELTVEPGLGRFVLTHTNASHNCCGLIEMDVEMVDGVIVISEREVFDEEHVQCRCNCEFTLSAEVTGVTAGEHTVRVVNAETDEPYGDDVSVTVLEPERSFNAEGGPGRIDLIDLNSVHNCCQDVAFEFSIDDFAIAVWEVASGELCDCECAFDLSASILELLEGTYTVQLFNGAADGDPIGDPISATVGPPNDIIDVEVNEDTLVIHHINAEWNCCGAVEMQVTVVGNTILVEEIETYPEGEACFCLCFYDLSVEASGFEAGTYTVEVFTEHGEGEDFGEVEVDIPGLPDDPSDEETVIASVTDDLAIEVVHSGATYNCCSTVVMEATVEADVITVQEVITNDELCHCVCDFEISAEITPYLPGAYTVTVYNADGTVAGTDTVEFEGDDPAVLPESINVVRAGTTVSIDHRAAPFNCCATVQMVLTVQDDELEVTELVTNPDEICDCECVFDLYALISDLQADTDYTLSLWRDFGEGEAMRIHEEVLEGE